MNNILVFLSRWSSFHELPSQLNRHSRLPVFGSAMTDIHLYKCSNLGSYSSSTSRHNRNIISLFNQVLLPQMFWPSNAVLKKWSQYERLTNKSWDMRLTLCHAAALLLLCAVVSASDQELDKNDASDAASVTLEEDGKLKVMAYIIHIYIYITFATQTRRFDY